MASHTHRLLLAATALAASGALAACGSSTATTATTTKTAAVKTTAPASSSPATSARVAIRNFMYAPMTLTVKAGAKVTFTNYDQTAHTATSISPGFDTGTIKPGQSATVTLSKPGTYKYHCLFHAFMLGTITVAP
jgi:plastocyanin